MTDKPYYADSTPEEAWEALSAQSGAALVDVRTRPEWAFVGGPDLSGIAAPLVRAEWQAYPAMEVDPGFVESVGRALREAGSGPDAPVFFLCRSGGRSAAAAAAMTAAGFRHCHNIIGGFEGGRDGEGHRGTVEGWKAAGLPWIQS